MSKKDEELAKRSAERRKRMVTHRAVSFEDAERWDLAYWQSRTPQERLSALVDIREDVRMVDEARRKASERKGR